MVIGGARATRFSGALTAALLSAALGFSAVLVGLQPQHALASDDTAGVSSQKKLRNGLDRLLADPSLVDPRLAGLVRDHRAGEIPVFALLSMPNDASRRKTLRLSGARILRSYQTVPLVALAALPDDIGLIADLSWVRWLLPVEVVRVLEHEDEVDQSDPPIGTAIDMGVPALWDQGVTGQGIRIAILDTGMDLLHPDLDDLDFRHWGDPPNTPTINAPKVVDARNFNGGCAAAAGGFDAHGHGTHVAGIAAGTGEGDPTTAADDGQHMGIAPDAELAIAKVLTDAGAGLNSDLIAAFEWAAMPAGSGPVTCPAVGAHVVNTSLGSESRPLRLNSGHDIDMVSYVLDRLAARYGTVFVSAAGNSGPYLGSVLESPGGAAQAISVGATAKDWDVNHDATASGDTCAGYQHPEITCPEEAPGTQRRSLSVFSSRGPTEGRFLKPEVVAPGYNIVSAQSSHGLALAQNDLNIGTRDDPFYATATGTSMASPAAAGVAALLLDGYRDLHGRLPKGPSGLPGVKAPAYVLVKAAMMNTAAPDLHESRWILSVDSGTAEDAAQCPDTPDPLLPIVCDFADILTGGFLGSLVLSDVRNGADDPFVGPLGEGAGRIRPQVALRALRDGVVIYRAADKPRAATAPGNQDYQGAWHAGLLTPGTAQSDRFLLKAAPGAVATTATFSFVPGQPSDGSRAIPTSGIGAWSIGLPGQTAITSGGSARVAFSVLPPKGTPAGIYSGSVVVDLSNGQVLRVPLLANVAMLDKKLAEGNLPGKRARIVSETDVYARGDTIWPSLVGAANGAKSDWQVFLVEMPAGASRARFTAWDAAEGDETYDLYLYDKRFDLVASTHPFAAPGVTDASANDARGPSTEADPQVLDVEGLKPGLYRIVVNRARVGTVDPIKGDFGAFVLTLDSFGGP
jgi:subtilisin family serine protease